MSKPRRGPGWRRSNIFDMTGEWMEIERRRYHEELRRERSHHPDDRGDHDDQKSDEENPNAQVRGQFF
jgi:hypothetical protein